MNKKALGAVVATALLIVVTVVAVIGFQTWFSSYSSDLLVKVEKDFSQINNIQIKALIDEQLYLKNDKNVSIKQILINNKKCNISINLSQGMHNFSLNNCLNSLPLTNSIVEITVVTENQVISKKYSFKDINLVSQNTSLVEEDIKKAISTNSLLFDGTDDYFTKTYETQGNHKVWTYSSWVKPVDSSTGTTLFVFWNQAVNGWTMAWINTDGKLWIGDYQGGYNWQVTSTNILDDYSHWYHIMIVYNSSEIINSDRVKMFIDGKEVNSFDSPTYPSLNEDSHMNYADDAYLFSNSGSVYFTDEYFTQINYIDGKALSVDNFGEKNNYGKWVPKKYNGDYGTNGFYLTFQNASNLGEDFSGNGNNWVVNSNPIQTVDIPENNFAVLNPLDNLGVSVNLHNGNLESEVISSSGRSAFSSLRFNNNNISYYLEVTTAELNTGSSSSWVGLVNGPETGEYVALYRGNGVINKDLSLTGTYSSWNEGDIISLLVNTSSNYFEYKLNNILQYSGVYSSEDDELTLELLSVEGGSLKVNFGATNFSYSIPDGYKTLSSANLIKPTVIPSQGFDILTYTGTGASQDIEGLDFSPSLVWIKNRVQTDSNKIFDILRGTRKYIETDTNNEETTDSDSLTSFNSNGFSLGTGTNGFNDNGENFVAWNWKESPQYGLDILNYTGNGVAGRQINHNLGKKPDLILVKIYSGTQMWGVYESDLGATKYLRLDDSVGVGTSTSPWNDVEPTENYFTLGDWTATNAASHNYIAYLFTSIPGFSKIGRYSGNSNTNGPFVYTGFKPKYVMVKSTGDNSGSWVIWDSKRDAFNPVQKYLVADLANSETAANGLIDVDFLSNGFKLKGTGGGVNGAYDYIYMAFAEYPMSTNYN